MKNIFDKFYVRLILVLLISLYISETGSTIGFFHRLVTFDFYKEYFATVLIAQIVFELVYFINQKLEGKYQWTAGWFKRLIAQVGLGIAIPALIVLLLATGYFSLFGVNILKTDYLYYIFPLVLVLIFFLNVILVMTPYFMIGLHLNGRQNELHPSLSASSLSGTETMTSLPIKEAIKAYRGQMVTFLDPNEIKGAYIIGGNVLLVTKMKEELVTDFNLDELETLLDKGNYFRINRQLIAARQFCKGYQVIEFGKLEVELDFPVPVKAVVSQLKAKAFKEWIGSNA
ncbi:MAG: LytTR family DNA-binding domain-containing protein [Sphingobacterium sp.]